ncbi:amidase [Inquilinus sp.]|uniref:amidase n=1 Tax=Inquilinus sp. TaxID=1932117 RepID=UPI0031D98250
MAIVTEALIRDYAARDGLGLAEWVRSGDVSPAELAETAITAIERLNPQINAVTIKAYDLGRQAAAQAPAGAPFAGVPFLLKDLGSQWQGVPATASCAYLQGLPAPVDGESTRRVKQAGFSILGRTNVPENGWCISTEPRLHGPTRNPWRADVTSGGSSGGSAAAVAARMVPLAEATDGAGSIRVPASNCGLVGLKPSRGRVSFAPGAVDVWYGGVFFLCVSRTVRDTAAYLDAVAGGTPGDPYTPATPSESWSTAAKQRAKGLRLAMVARAPDGKPLHPEVTAALQNTARLLEGLGHRVEEIDLDFDAATAWAAYTRMGAVQTAAMFAALEPVIGRPVTPEEVEPITWAALERGRSISGVGHAADIEALRQFGRGLVGQLLPFDAVLTPALTQPPRPLGHWDMTMTDYDAYNALWSDAVFMFPFNLSGLPAMSLPMHWTPDGLPVGVQLVGRGGDEATLLRLATQLEAAQPWIDRRPPVCVGA